MNPARLMRMRSTWATPPRARSLPCGVVFLLGLGSGAALASLAFLIGTLAALGCCASG